MFQVNENVYFLNQRESYLDKLFICIHNFNIHRDQTQSPTCLYCFLQSSNGCKSHCTFHLHWHNFIQFSVFSIFSTKCIPLSTEMKMAASPIQQYLNHLFIKGWVYCNSYISSSSMLFYSSQEKTTYFSGNPEWCLHSIMRKSL